MNCISISYKIAPIEIRNLLAFDFNEKAQFFDQIEGQCVILSTCNRLEIYFDIDINAMEEQLCRFKALDRDALMPYIATYTSAGAIRHLARVACGMDSMVLGEDEIYRQVKEAYEDARQLKKTSYTFNTIFQMVMKTVKQIKTQTGLSSTSVSIGTLAAHAVFDFGAHSVLIIGISGKIGSITAKNILAKPNIALIGTTRQHNVSLFATYPQVTMKPYKERYDLIPQADVIISATSSPHYTITKAELEKHIDTKPRLFIDLAVPNDMDPHLQELPHCTYLNIDHFQQLAKTNNQKKLGYAQRAQVTIDQGVSDILKELRMHDLIAYLPQIKEKTMESFVYSLRKTDYYEQMDAIASWLEKWVTNQ